MSAAKKKYQVFVSSTYGDLKEERSKVIKALWELNCIPVAMEMFPASDSTAWETITSMINECDYYILIIKGRYGSIDPESGKSFTEKEYLYATEKGIPVSSFLFKDPKTLAASETDEIEELEKTGGKAKKILLGEFRERVKLQRTCKFWSGGDELTVQVVLAINSVINRDIRPGVGWVRATDETDPAAVLKLHTRIEELEAALEKANEEGDAPSLDTLPDLDLEFSVRCDAQIGGETMGEDVRLRELLEFLGRDLVLGTYESHLLESLEGFVRSSLRVRERVSVSVPQRLLERIMSILQLKGIVTAVPDGAHVPEEDREILYRLTPAGKQIYLRQMATL